MLIIDGNRLHDPNYRDPINYPYSYSPFLIWHSRKKVENSRIHTSYSDRLYRQDSDKFNTVCLKYFGDTGQYFDQRSPKDVEGFIGEFHGYEAVELISIEQQCNQSSGFPYWKFEFTVKGEGVYS
jgi:hypothetical protein